jgi:hypothetical protein
LNDFQAAHPRALRRFSSISIHPDLAQSSGHSAVIPQIQPAFEISSHREAAPVSHLNPRPFLKFFCT